MERRTTQHRSGALSRTSFAAAWLAVAATLASCGGGDAEGRSGQSPATHEESPPPAGWEAPGAPSLVTTTEIAEQPGYVYAVDFAPDGSVFASGDANGLVRLWDSEGTLQETYDDHPAPVNDVAFSPDGSLLAAAGADRTVRVWELSSGELTVLDDAQDQVRSVAFSPDGEHLVTASWDEVGVRVYSVAGELVEEAEGEGSAESVAFSPDGSVLAVGGAGGDLELFKTSGWSRQHHLDGGGAGVGDLAFSPDGATLYGATNEPGVAVWDVADAERVQTLGDYDNYVQGLALSPDGTTLASGALDGTVRLHRVEAWEVAADLENNGGVNAMAFSPTEPFLVSTDGKRITGYAVE